MFSERKNDLLKRLDTNQPFSVMWMTNGMVVTFTESVLACKKFEVVISEQFKNGAHKGIAYHFQTPLIAFSPIGSGPWVNNLVGNPQSGTCVL